MPIAPTRAPFSISRRRSSRASPRLPRNLTSPPCRPSISMRSDAAKSSSNRNCRRSGAVHCWRYWDSIMRSRLRGRLALTLDEQKTVEGEVGLDTLDLAPAFALAIGAAGRDAAEPFGAGLVKGWRGRIAFQALHGSLPGGGELRPFGGTIKSDGQSLTFDSIRGMIGGGEATASFDAKPTANGIALNAGVQLSGGAGP